MKKLFTFMLLALSFSAFTMAQSSYVLDGFENGHVNFTSEVHLNPATNMDTAVVANPAADAVNSTTKCWKWTRLDAGADNQVWAGFWSSLTTPIDAGCQTITVKFYRTNANSTLKIHCESTGSAEFFPVTAPTKVNQWEELTFDVASNWTKNITVLGFQPDFPADGSTIDVGASMYIDEITVTRSSYVLDNFENGHVNFTGTVNLNPADNMDTAVVANPAADAVNSTTKCWKWTRLDAGAGNQVWAGFWSSLTTPIAAGCKTITVKFYRTNANSLLKIHCESTGSAEFFPVTAPTKVNQWEELTFDVASNWTKNITVFGFQPDFPADGSTIDVGANMYVDEITVTTGTPPPPPTSLTLFDDSSDGTDNTYHDGSYISATTPSTVLQATGHDGKFPVVTSPVESGTNALELDWKSVTGGDWVAMVAGNAWPVFDVSTMVNLKFWVNSPVVLAKTAMPMLYLESASGNPNHTGKVNVGNYLSADLAANTWTAVTIPLADLWAADVTFTAKDAVHGVFFSQNATDNVEHTLYLDEFTFNSTTTGLNVQKANNAINAYYFNGQIHTSDYTGYMRVYDLLGRNVTEGIASRGYLNVNLKNGIYIVNTTKGNSKIVVQ